MANRKELKGSRKATKVPLKFTGRFSTSETSALARIFLKITGELYYYIEESWVIITGLTSDTGRMDRSQFRDMLHSTFDMNDDGMIFFAFSLNYKMHFHKSNRFDGPYVSHL